MGFHEPGPGDNDNSSRESAIHCTQRATGKIVAICWLMLLSAASHARAGEPTLNVDSPVSSEGYILLSWDTGSDGQYLLQRALTPDFRETLDRSIAGAGSLTITGLTDNRYYFRVGDPQGGWSNPVEVTVAHHSLGRAFAFFSLGLVPFAVLVFTIISGHRQTRSEMDGA